MEVVFIHTSRTRRAFQKRKLLCVFGSQGSGGEIFLVHTCTENFGGRGVPPLLRTKWGEGSNTPARVACGTRTLELVPMSTLEREAVARPHMRDGAYASRSRVPAYRQAGHPCHKQCETKCESRLHRDDLKRSPSQKKKHWQWCFFLLVAGAGFAPAISRLWAWRDTTSLSRDIFF